MNADKLRLTAAALAVALAAIPAFANGLGDDLWPQWRGPARDGSAGGGPWPDDLEGLELVWRVELGKGYPGPIVAHDRVFVAETVDGKSEVVRALGRQTGRELWRAEWPGEGSVPFFARANGDWIRSTPAFDGGTLYVGGMNEVLVALDAATGEERWRVDFPSRFGTKVPDFGFASSPLVAGGHVYVQAANSLVKLDKASGATVWRALENAGDIMVSGAFSSPILTELAGREQLVVQTRLALHGVNPETGEVLWSHDVPHFRGMNILTPTVHGDGVFTSSYRNRTFFYSVTARDDGGFDVAEAWSHKVQAYMSSPVVVDGHVYLHLGNQRLTCLDLATGESRWTTEPFGKYWSKAVQDDKILALDERGDLHLIRANPESFELLDSKKVSDQSTWGHLAVAGRELYVRELEAVAAYRWTRPPSASAAAASAE